MKGNEFKARDGYRDETIVSDYDRYRFTSIKGLLTNALELRVIEQSLALAKLPPGASILDIPCGTGRLSLHLASKGYKVSGADISEAMVAISTKKSMTVPEENRPSFFVSDGERLQFPDDSFDAVLSLRLFGHVPPPIRASMLKEFRRVSRNHLVLAYYHAASLQCLLRKQKRAQRGVPWYPVFFGDIHREMAVAGLRVVKITPMILGVSETVVVVATRA